MKVKYLILLIAIQLPLLLLLADQSVSIRQELDRSKYYSGQEGYITVWASNNLGWKVFVRKVTVSFDWGKNYSIVLSTPKLLAPGQTDLIGRIKFQIPLDDEKGERFCGDHSYTIFIETMDDVYGTRKWENGPYTISIEKALPSLSFSVVSYTSEVEQEGDLIIDISLVNSGTGPSTDTQLRVYVDGNPMFYKRLDVVKPGIYPLKLKWTVPVPDIVAGSHKLVIRIYCREISEPVVSDTLEITVKPPYEDYFMGHLGNLFQKRVEYRKEVGGKTVTVTVDYRIIIAAKRTKYCGLENIPPAFSIDDQISQWKAGFSMNRMYNSITGCWYYVYFPASYKG